MQHICLQRESKLYKNKINHMITHVKHIKADLVLIMHFSVCPGLVTDTATGEEKGNAKCQTP